MQTPSIETALSELAAREIDLVRVLWSDLHGVARGKEFTVDELADIAGHGVAFCQAVLLTDLSAVPLERAETSGGGWQDAVARLDLSTMAYPPFAPGVALCLANVHDPRTGEPLDFSPRDLLRAQVERLGTRSLRPILAPELEFYLHHPDGTPYVDRETAGYVVGSANDPSGMLSLLLRQCRALGLEVFAGNQEFSGGQFEINHRHSDAVNAADRAFLFKYAVKEIVAQQGLRATFMGMPFNGRAGSGTHIHVSLLDGNGQNAFEDPLDEHGLSDQARGFLAGVLDHAPALTAILNPTVNAFKRLRAGDLVPVVADWGPDNRTAFVRVPGERGAATRFEIRVGDGTTNPYLAFAALLAAGFDGIERDLAPPSPAVAGTTGRGIRLPGSLDEALGALKEDKILAQGLGERFTDVYSELKLQELDRYSRTVTDWEFREYGWLL